MSGIKLTLPWPASNGNHQYTIARNRKILSGSARLYKKEVDAWCLVERVKPLGGPLRATIRLFRPRRVGDVDGPIKQILDAVQGHAYANDSQIVELHVYRGDDKHRPRVELEIDTA